jgi:hypothetical protein
MNDRKNRRARMFLALAVILPVSCLCGFEERPPLKFLEEPLPAGRVGEYYQGAVGVLNAETPPIEFIISEGALPDGLELQPHTMAAGGNEAYEALIEGVPEEPGTFAFTIQVRCFGTMVNGQVGEKEYILIVEE